MRRSELGLFATHEGRFIVRTDDRTPGQELRPNPKIVLYSARLEPLKEFALSFARSSESEPWRVYATATRRSIIAEHRVGRRIDVRWLGPDTLEPRATWAWVGPETPDPFDTGLDMSDSRIVATFRRRANLFSGEKGRCEVAVREIDGPWRQLFGSDDFCSPGAEFVNQNVVIFAYAGKIHLFGVDGQALLDERLGNHEFAHVVHASANGRRFAIAVATTRGGSELLDISPHEVLKRIMVYDIPSHRWIHTLDGKGVDLKYVSGFALSLSGLQFALLRKGFVEVYRLPEDQSATGNGH